jgi:hypothetical protein
VVIFFLAYNSQRESSAAVVPEFHLPVDRIGGLRSHHENAIASVPAAVPALEKSPPGSPPKLVAPTVRISLEKRPARLADIRLAALIEKQDIQVLAAVKNRPESSLDLLHDLRSVAAWRHQP